MAVSIVNQVGKDFGGYVDIGLLGTMGSDMANTGGKCYGGWVKLFDATVTPFMLTWFGVPAMPNQYCAFMLQTKWTTDYAPQANCILAFVDSQTGVGWAYWKDWTGTLVLNDGNYHHILLNFSGLTSGKPTMCKIWIDGVGYDMLAANDVSDPGGLTGGVANFTKNIYLGCDGKTDAMTPIDMSTINIERLGIWNRALSDDQIIAMFKSNGAYFPKYGLISYHPFFKDGRNLGPNGYTAALHNNAGGSSDPTYVTRVTSAKVRRKFL
jgi:hypothetical protein